MQTIIIDKGLNVAGFSELSGFIVKFPSGYYKGMYQQTGNPEQARSYKSFKYALKIAGISGEVIKIILK